MCGVCLSIIHKLRGKHAGAASNKLLELILEQPPPHRTEVCTLACTVCTSHVSGCNLDHDHLVDNLCDVCKGTGYNIEVINLIPSLQPMHV